MNYTTKLYVSQKDLDTYNYKSSRNEKIFLFWRMIMEKMPLELKIEVRTKPTYLNLVNEKEKVYQFETVGASEDLKLYLNEFSVIHKEMSIAYDIFS